MNHKPPYAPISNKMRRRCTLLVFGIFVGCSEHRLPPIREPVADAGSSLLVNTLADSLRIRLFFSPTETPWSVDHLTIAIDGVHVADSKAGKTAAAVPIDVGPHTVQLHLSARYMGGTRCQRVQVHTAKALVTAHIGASLGIELVEVVGSRPLQQRLQVCWSVSGARLSDDFVPIVPETCIRRPALDRAVCIVEEGVRDAHTSRDLVKLHCRKTIAKQVEGLLGEAKVGKTDALELILRLSKQSQACLGETVGHYPVTTIVVEDC